MTREWRSKQWLRVMVFGTPARNPAMLPEAAAAVIVMATLAATVSAWRATRIDFVYKLRAD